MGGACQGKIAIAKPSTAEVNFPGIKLYIALTTININHETVGT